MAVPLSNKDLAGKITEIFDNANLRQQTIDEINLKGLK